MSRLDRVKHPEARLLLGRASRRQRVGDTDGALKSAAAALSVLVAASPAVSTALAARPAPQVLIAMAKQEPPPAPSTPNDAIASVEFVLQLALGLGL